jgi:hypothetical protein
MAQVSATGQIPRRVNRTVADYVHYQSKIDTALIIQIYTEHLTGERELSATQVAVGNSLLSRVLPTLQAVAVQVDDKRPLTKADVDAKMLASGVDPAAIWASIDSKAPKSVPAAIEHDKQGQSIDTESNKPEEPDTQPVVMHEVIRE